MNEIKKIIFDTDLGDDCDDVMALDLLMSCANASECELLGVTYSANSKMGPHCIYAILKQHHYSHLPLGRAPVQEGKFAKDTYAAAVAEAYPDKNAPVYESTPDAVTVLRKLLAENDKVTLIVTGYLTNIAALLKSEPDEISSLDGIGLVREKVNEIAIMGGNFSHENCINPIPELVNSDGNIAPAPEWNIMKDIPAAKYVFENSPVDLVCCPFEVGRAMLTGKPMREHGEGRLPDSMSFTVHGSLNGRDSWDPATALYGVFGAAPWFYRTASGRVAVDDRGVTYFNTLKGGNHYIIQCSKTQAEVAEEIDRLVMRLFD